MSRIRTLTIALFVAALPFVARAQTPPPDPPKAETKKSEPRKTEAKKTAKQAPAKKPPAKKAAAKKPEPVLVNTDKPLVLRDKSGNVIPTTPDAFNVDSAKKK